MANVAVFGIYATRESAESSVASLKAAGFRHTDISVLLPENQGSKDLAHVKSSKAPEGATMGGTSGAVLGGALGWLVGAGVLTISGVGPLLFAAGPLVAAFAGAGAGGAAGGVAGALIGLSIPEYEAKRYEGRVRNGGILLSVHADDADWAKRGKKLLAETGAEQIAASSEERGDYANADRPRPR
jgi:hypothetical protein